MFAKPEKIRIGTKSIDRIFQGTNLIWGEYPYQQESLDFIERVTTEGFTMPPEAHLIARDKLIKNLKQAGTFWDTRDAIQMYAVNDATITDTALIDLKNPLGNLVIEGGGSSFNVNGHKGDGVDKYLDTNVDVLAATNLDSGDMGITIVNMNDYVVDVNSLIGIQYRSPTRRLGFFPKAETNRTTFFAINNLERIYPSTPISDPYFMSFGRDGDTIYSFVDGVFDSITIVESGVLKSSNFLINATNRENTTGTFTPNYFCNGTIGFFAIGSKISAEEDKAVRAAINTYLVDIGLSEI